MKKENLTFKIQEHAISVSEIKVKINLRYSEYPSNEDAMGLFQWKFAKSAIISVGGAGIGVWLKKF